MNDTQSEVGSIEFGPSGPSFRSTGQVKRDAVFALVLLCGGVGGIAWMGFPEVEKMLMGVVSFGLYCVLSYWIRPKPNHDNLGEAQGLIDRPFAVSDGINRTLVWISALLALGRYISTSLVEGSRYLKTGKLSHERLLDEMDHRVR